VGGGEIGAAVRPVAVEDVHPALLAEATDALDLRFAFTDTATMSTNKLTKESASHIASPDLAAEFRRLAEEWKARSAHLSSVTEMALLPSYQRIIGLGRPAVPLILRELEAEPDYWFWALQAITGVDPVPEASRGRLEEMTEAWLNWGREQGHL
jgi:hypothetical protein